MRPTMSMLIMATTSVVFTPAKGVRVKCVEPSTPDSSPENEMNTTSRRSSLFRERECARGFEQRRGARGVVIGADMRLVLVWRERIAPAQTQDDRSAHRARRPPGGALIRRRPRGAGHDVERLLLGGRERNLELGPGLFLLLERLEQAAATRRA